MSEGDAPDLVGEVFGRMRATAKMGGKHPPSLQRPARKNSGFTLEAGPRVIKRDDDGGTADTAGNGGDHTVARDLAGTRIPERFLYLSLIHI